MGIIAWSRDKPTRSKHLDLLPVSVRILPFDVLLSCIAICYFTFRLCSNIPSAPGYRIYISQLIPELVIPNMISFIDGCC
jgi:hypothetical protein